MAQRQRNQIVLLSPNLKVFLDSNETHVLAMPDWGAASDHQPVCVRLNLAD